MWGADQFRTVVHLRRALTPELYRRNAFRVCGLTVDATAREVRRRGEQVRAARRLGGVPLPYRPLLMEPAPDLDSVDEALAALRRPEARLVDELFWFWSSDVDLDAPAGGSDDFRATHDLAVRCHLLALDAELAGTAETTDPLWADAYRAWLATWRSEAFWAAFAERVERLERPGFGPETVAGFRAELPVVLVGINAILGADALERGLPEQVAERHWRLARDRSVPEPVRRRAARLGTDPLFTRVEAECTRVGATLTATPQLAKELGHRLYEKTRPLLRTLDVAGSSGAAGAHDAVARRLLESAVVYHNQLPDKEKDWPGVGELVDLAVQTARGAVVQAHVRLNKAIVDDELTELSREEKQRQAVAVFEARKAAAEAKERAEQDARQRRYAQDAQRDREERLAREAGEQAKAPAPEKRWRYEPPRGGIEAPGPPVQPYRTDGSPAGDYEAIRRATMNGTICVYCRKRADKDSSLFLRLVRGNQRREFFLTRCRDCAARRDHHVGALQRLALLLTVAMVGLLIAAAVWLKVLFIGAGVVAVALVVTGVLAGRARRAEWAEISPTVTDLIGDGWRQP